MFDIRSWLDTSGRPYQWSHHRDAFTSSALAHREHVPDAQVIKPVLVKIDGEFVLCALPATHRIDLSLLQVETGAQEAALADEADLSEICPECELGAEPPIGWMFGLATLMDESLFEDQRVTFQAGTHRDSVTMSFIDYYHLTRPVIGSFGHHR